jgi:hypothetical protein
MFATTSSSTPTKPAAAVPATTEPAATVPATTEPATTAVTPSSSSRGRPLLQVSDGSDVAGVFQHLPGPGFDGLRRILGVSDQHGRPEL